MYVTYTGVVTWRQHLAFAQATLLGACFQEERLQGGKKGRPCAVTRALALDSCS